MEALAKSEAAKNRATFAVIGDFTEKNPEFTARWNEAVVAARTWAASGAVGVDRARFRRLK